MKLFIGSLPYNTTEAELSALCATYGEVVSVKIITDQFTGRSKGFGFVEMIDRSAGHKVMESLNGKEFKNKALVYNEAKPQTKKSPHRR